MVRRHATGVLSGRMRARDGRRRHYLDTEGLLEDVRDLGLMGELRKAISAFLSSADPSDVAMALYFGRPIPDDFDALVERWDLNG